MNHVFVWGFLLDWQYNTSMFVGIISGKPLQDFTCPLGSPMGLKDLLFILNAIISPMKEDLYFMLWFCYSFYFAKGIAKCREKYILVPQTTTIFPDGTPNYQHLHSDPPNYHFLIFWPHPSIYTVNSNKNWPKLRKYPSFNRENFKV
jgi:hypothetical protein